jgi:hypothetical protein
MTQSSRGAAATESDSCWSQTVEERLNRLEGVMNLDGTCRHNLDTRLQEACGKLAELGNTVGMLSESFAGQGGSTDRVTSLDAELQELGHKVQIYEKKLASHDSEILDARRRIIKDGQMQEDLRILQEEVQGQILHGRDWQMRLARCEERLYGCENGLQEFANKSGFCNIPSQENSIQHDAARLANKIILLEHDVQHRFSLLEQKVGGLEETQLDHCRQLAIDKDLPTARGIMMKEAPQAESMVQSSAITALSQQVEVIDKRLAEFQAERQHRILTLSKQLQEQSEDHQKDIGSLRTALYEMFASLLEESKAKATAVQTQHERALVEQTMRLKQLEAAVADAAQGVQAALPGWREEAAGLSKDISSLREDLSSTQERSQEAMKLLESEQNKQSEHFKRELEMICVLFHSQEAKHEK